MDKRKKLRASIVSLCVICSIALLSLVLTFGVFKVKFYAPHRLFNQYTMYPFRSTLEHMGTVVTWDSRGHKIEIQKGMNSFNLDITTGLIQGIPIFVNNDYIGKSPVFKRLFAGKYQIIAREQRYVGTIRFLTLKPGQPSDQQIVLPVEQHNYPAFLDEILRLGYHPIRVMDYYNHVPITKKTIILRHDVDVSAADALKMAEAEHARGIKSTFYFRWCTVDPKVIKAIRAMGDEVGLHYETLATYARENHLTSAKQITPAVQAECRRRLKLEIKEFEQRYGKIYTISSHGANENIELGVSNYQAIMAGQNPHDYGIIGTAYGDITKHFTYMSDVGGVWDPFPYPLLANNNGPFYILTHPIHWGPSFNLT